MGRENICEKLFFSRGFHLPHFSICNYKTGTGRGDFCSNLIIQNGNHQPKTKLFLHSKYMDKKEWVTYFWVQLCCLHYFIYISPCNGVTHLNRDKIESNLSVPGIKGHQENALIKGFEMSPPLDMSLC